MNEHRRFGIYEKALPGGSWPVVLDSAAAAGYDFIEMSIDESDERLARLDWSSSQRSKLNAACQERAIPIFSICLSAHRRYGLGSTDEETRGRGAEVLEKAIGLAADLGIRVVQIAGYHAYYEPPDPGARDRYVQGLQDGLRFAAARGVMLAVENIDTPDTRSVGDALQLRDELASPWFQIYPDVGNLAVHQLDVVSEVRQIGGAAVGLHLKDARPGEPRRVPFGHGIVPFDDLFAALAAVPYDGPFTVEMWNDDPGTAVQLATSARRWLSQKIDDANVSTGMYGRHS